MGRLDVLMILKDFTRLLKVPANYGGCCYDFCGLILEDQLRGNDFVEHFYILNLYHYVFQKKPPVIHMQLHDADDTYYDWTVPYSDKEWERQYNMYMDMTWDSFHERAKQYVSQSL